MAQLTLPQLQMDLIGQGLALPISFSEDMGGVALFDGIDLIQQAIDFVLSTRKGEYFGNPDFGSRIIDLLFEPVIFTSRLVFEAREALSAWLPQIQVLDLHAFTDEMVDATVYLAGSYSIRNTPIRGSFVYPFDTGGAPLV